jgi:hypothetical protein
MDIYPEYLSTIFIAEPLESKWPDRFFIITACNPRSSGVRSVDDKAHVRLRKTLSRAGCWKHRVDGASPDWKHREKGYAVSGLDVTNAIELGKEFDQNAIFEVVNGTIWVVACSNAERAKVARWDKRLYLPTDNPKFRIYVVRLDDAVLSEKRFVKANPDYISGKPCYYIGMTGLTTEERFANHKAGYKACKLVKKYGLHLARKKFEHIPLLSLSDAQAKEVAHAEHLRSQGYAVWQK